MGKTRVATLEVVGKDWLPLPFVRLVVVCGQSLPLHVVKTFDHFIGMYCRTVALFICQSRREMT